MANGNGKGNSQPVDFRPWVGIFAVAAFVAMQSVLHFSDGSRHETREQKENRIRRIVTEEIDRQVPPPEVKSEMRRLKDEIERLKEKVK